MNKGMSGQRIYNELRKTCIPLNLKQKGGKSISYLGHKITYWPNDHCLIFFPEEEKQPIAFRRGLQSARDYVDLEVSKWKRTKQNKRK